MVDIILNTSFKFDNQTIIRRWLNDIEIQFPVRTNLVRQRVANSSPPHGTARHLFDLRSCNVYLALRPLLDYCAL